MVFLKIIRLAKLHWGTASGNILQIHFHYYVWSSNLNDYLWATIIVSISFFAEINTNFCSVLQHVEIVINADVFFPWQNIAIYICSLYIFTS